MRSILASLCLLLSTGAHAQFSLSINSGIEAPGPIHNYNSYTSINNVGTLNPIGNKQQAKPVFSLSGYWTKRNWQYGFSFDRYQTPTLTGSTFAGTVSYWSPGSYVWIDRQSYMEVNYKATYPVKAFLNRTIALKRFTLSGGITAGYILAPGLQHDYFEQPFNLSKTGNYGFSGGAQLGASYKWAKHFSINARLAEEYIYIHQGNPVQIGYNVTSATVGLGYTF